MATASLIISIVALLAAGASVHYTRQQSRSTARLREIEDQRRRGEREPRFEAAVEPLNDGQGTYFRLYLRLRSPESVDALHVYVLDTPNVVFTAGQLGVPAAGSAPAVVASLATSPLRPGERATWQLEIREPRPTRLELRVTPRIRANRWESTLSVLVPSRRGLIV